MKISYSITCYNEHRELDNLLYHLSHHIRNEDEVILVGNKFQADRFHPQHGTFDILRNY